MKHELLSPAGDFETLKQVIHNGCDAVYIGGKKFGARKFASNFDNDEIIKAIKYAHLFGVKIYVTVNTVIFDEEIDDCLQYITFLHENGVDAIIMQDVGMIKLVRQVLPNLDIHVSTQAHTHNIEQIKLLETLGVTRIVVARELSLEEIKKIDTKLEIETFIHGALCVCYSGQCLFSSMLLNRSGNRGECAGICRLPFTLLEDKKEVKTEGKYLLSPKELNNTNRIKELLESNITSFKIEGRMKNATTIGFITKLYRTLIDHYYNNEDLTLTNKEQEELMVLFNRGFTNGYLFNQTGKNLMNIISPNHIGIEIGKVIEITPKKIKIKLTKDLNQEDGIRFKESGLGLIANFIYDVKDNLISKATSNDIIYLDNKVGLSTLDTVLKTTDSKLIKELENYKEKKIPVTIKGTAKLNELFYLTIDDGINTITIKEDIIEKANKSGTSKDRIINQLSKLGDTIFSLKECTIESDNNIFIPISKINELRRKIITELINVRENTKKEVIINKKEDLTKNNSNNKLSISCLVRNKEQLKECINQNIDNIYVTDYDLYKEYKDKYNIYYRINRVINNFKDFNNERLLVGETGSINKYRNNNELIGDYYLNVTNSYNVSYLRDLNLKRITLSIENSIYTISNIISNVGNSNLEVIVYGRIEAMITKYCPLKMLINNDKVPCNICRNNKKYELKDRNNSIYPIRQENELTHIFYHQDYSREKEIKDLLKLGISNFRFEFLDESIEDIRKIIEKFNKIITN